MKGSNMRLRLIILIVFIFSLFHVTTYGETILSSEHISYINDLFKKNGIANGYVELDQYGRLKLNGVYEDEMEVDKAFSIAQSVVGVRWVSPVTPENIKVKEWEKQLSKLMERAKVLSARPKKDASPPGPIKNRYAVIVGVGKFLDPRINPLQYSVRDATSFYNFLTDPKRGGFKREDVLFLTDQNATRSNILNALNRIKSLAQEDDLVVVYVSTHGTPPDKFGGVHIVTYDTEVQPRERVWHTAISDKIWKEFIDETRAKRIVLILDTCYSNGAYRNVPGFLPPGGKSIGVVGDEGSGISKEYAKRVTGAKDIILEESTPKRQQASSKSLFGEDGWGIVMMSASGPDERSWESDNLRQSYFTYYFIEGLNRKNGSVRDAFFYAKPIVQQKVPAEKKYVDPETNQLVIPNQTPQVYVTNETWNIKVIKK
jgi:uncharacterized caspase-like protein